MDLLRLRRRERKRAELVEPDEFFCDRRDEEEWKAFVRDEALRRLRSAVSPEHFQVFYMLAVECRSVREVAHFFDVPQPTVYSTFRRTRKVLERIVRDIEREAF